MKGAVGAIQHRRHELIVNRRATADQWSKDMSHLYTTKITAVGGRNGTVRSEDGILNLSLAIPKALGGKRGRYEPGPTVRRRLCRLL